MADLTISTAPTLYECCGLFDLCTDRDLMSLSFKGQEPFLDWIGWQSELNCIINRAFITWQDVVDGRDLGYDTVMPDPCDTPRTYEFGTCDWELRDFGRLRSRSPVRDITQNAMKYCESQPRYRLDGTLINNTREWDIRFTTEIIMQTLKRLIISGSASNDGEFDGLQQLIRTGFTATDGRHCTSMDSQIIDWNGNPMAGGAGVTWNGQAVGDTFNLIDVLLAAWRRVQYRISMAPSLASQRWTPGDTVLVMPSFLVHCLLDYFTCWSVCDGTEADTGVMKVINTLEGRRFRDSLLGGAFGYGAITLDGNTIPVIAYDWGTIQGPSRGDIYMLTGRIGGQRLINGQYLDMRNVPGAGYPGAEKFEYLDGGRLLTWMETDETCVSQRVEFRPRLLSWAPWAQIRIEDVSCATVGGPMSPDPWDTSYFAEQSFFAAECPEEEVVTPE